MYAGFTEYGRGILESTPCPNLIKVRISLSHTVHAYSYIHTYIHTYLQSLGLKSGVVTTSNSLDHNESDDVIMAENGNCCMYMYVQYVCVYTCQLSMYVCT